MSSHDLRPSTILLNEYNQLKLCDFGLARKTVDHINPSKDSYAKSKTGSPYYMAPELFQDDGVYSFASDMWSLGCVLFELTTGKPPFYSSSLQKLMNMIQNDQAPIHQISASDNMKDIFTMLLQKDPLK